MLVRSFDCYKFRHSFMTTFAVVASLITFSAGLILPTLRSWFKTGSSRCVVGKIECACRCNDGPATVTSPEGSAGGRVLWPAFFGFGCGLALCVLGCFYITRCQGSGTVALQITEQAASNQGDEKALHYPPRRRGKVVISDGRAV